MINVNNKLWIHFFLIIAMLSLLMIGCNAEETTEAVPTQPTPTATVTSDETGEPTPTVTATEPVTTDEPTATATPTASPTPTSTTSYPDVPPELPPSFLIDFDSFTKSNDVSSIFPTTEQQMQFASFTPANDTTSSFTTAAFGEMSHWNHAALNVGFWSIVAVVGLAVPVAAFVASFHNIPYQQDDGSWIWSYDVRAAGVKHTAELHGIYIDDGVRWEMYVTKAGAYTDFLWYYGESDRLGTEGFWILKESPTKNHDLLQIDWHRNIADGTGYIKYTNIVPGGPENGGYIQVETTTQTPYDSFWDIYNKGQDNHTYIEWHSKSQEGRVKDQKRFADDNWHCWDGDHRNIVCP